MLGAAILWAGLGAIAAGDYVRPLGAKALDQATLDAEGFGDKKALARDDDGLRVTLAPGEAEAGWKAPAALRIGGDFTISATLTIRKLPKPASEDGVAVGLALAAQNADQPEATALRQIEADGADVYRTIDKNQAPGMMNQPMMMFDMFGQQMGPPPKPPRRTFPARGSTFRLEVLRQGGVVRYQVRDDLGGQPREIGQSSFGPGDVAGLKLFVSNRSAGEPVEVVLRELEVHADRIGGLGTAITTVFGKVVHGEPTAIEAGHLIVGGAPAAPPGPPPGSPGPPGPMPAPPPGGPPGPTGTVVVAAGPGFVTVAPAAAPAAVVAPATAVGDAPVPPPGPAATPTPTPTSNPPAGPPATPAAPPPPKAKLPLDEVESIAFERAATLSGRWLGQPNVDTTGPAGAPGEAPKPAAPKAGAGESPTAPPPGTVAPVAIPKVEPKPNGTRDVHLSLSGLRPSEIRQVMISTQTDKGPASWRLDTSGSPDWPLTLRRAGTESWADLFLEPPAGDCKDKMFAVNLTYADGQPGMAQVKATGPADPKLAFDPAAAAPALDARIFLNGDEQLFGKLEAIEGDSLRLTVPWGESVELPMARVVAVYMGMPDHKESPEAFAKRLKARGTEDLLLARSKDGEVVPIAGILEGLKADRLSLNYREKVRSLPLKQVEGFVLAARPEPKPAGDLQASFALEGGVILSGRLAEITPAAWVIEPSWGRPLKVPPAEVRGVRFRGGQMTFLSDLVPSQVEETPYFGRKNPHRKDLALDGGPLRLDGRAYAKGLAVHSRTALTYDLERRFARFEATVGFDESGRKKGRVDCRAFADGKEIYANPDLRADGPSTRLSLPVAGADQLRIVVDFGAGEDTGDRVIWADARLYRKPPPQGQAAKTTDTNPRPASGP